MSQIKLHLHPREEAGNAGPKSLGFGLPARISLGFIVAGLTVSQLSGQDLEVYETFTAIGQGETRATNSLGLEDLELSLPGLALEKQIDVLPGVNVSSRDPFGFYEWGNDIRLRTFQIEQVAVTVDGVPMGSNDPRYGTRATRVVDSENIESIKVNQGAGDLSTPAYEALGGSIKYSLRKPSTEQGVLLKFMMGSFSAQRAFGRFDTGEILPGLTAYVSASNFRFKTRGIPDYSLRKHVDVVLNYELEKGSISLQFGHNDRDDYDTVGIQWDRWRALETGVSPSSDSAALLFADNGYTEYTPYEYPELSRWRYGDYSDKGRKLGPPTYLTDGNPGSGANAIYYNMWRNGRIDQITRLVFDYSLSDSFTVDGNAYYQEKNNYGLWGVDGSAAEGEIRAGYSFDPNRTDIWAVMWYDAEGNPLDASGNALSMEDEFGSDHAIVAPGTVYDSALANGGYVAGVPGRTGRDEDFGGNRYGFNLKGTYHITDSTTIVAGAWYEFDRHMANRPNYNFTDGGAVNGWFNYDQFLFNNYFRAFETDTVMAFIEGTHAMLDGALTITGGAKLLSVDRYLLGQLSNLQWRQNTFTERSVKYEDSFLPQLGFTYIASDIVEIFGNYSENMSAPNHGTMTGDSFSDTLNPEYAENIDLGLRFTGSSLTASVAVFKINYTDRVLAIAQPPGDDSFTAGDTEYQNVGGVDSSGLEIGFEYISPIEGLRLIGAISYQKSEFQEDLYNTSGILSTGTSLDTDPSDGYYQVATGTDSFGKTTYDEFLAIGGKSMGNTPEIVVNIEAHYTIGDYRFYVGGKYYDEVFVNTLNTEPIDSYTIFKAGGTWRAPADSPLDGLSATVAIENLFDSDIWYARNYTDASNGQVVADRGRNITVTLAADF